MKKNILFVVSLLFGILMINAGMDKFFHFMPMPKDLPEKMLKAFEAFKEIGWLMPLVGLVEIIGGLTIIIPRTRALGALIMLPIVIGILLTNIIQDKSGLPIAIILCLVLGWILFENRQKYLPIIEK